MRKDKFTVMVVRCLAVAIAILYLFVVAYFLKEAFGMAMQGAGR